MCYGFEMAGYEPLLASEFVPEAADSYRANHPGVPVLTDDVREVSGERILAEVGLAPGELDVLEGGPPCQSFSTSGRLSKTWGDGRDDLFLEYARLLGELRPRAFVAENVSGLVKGVSKGYFKLIHAALAEKGYRVRARLLDAQWLGVPQVRKRVIFVGVREDLEREPAFPAPLPYRYSIRDALPHFVRVGYDGGRNTDKWKAPPPQSFDAGDRPSPTVQAQGYYGDHLDGDGTYWVEAAKVVDDNSGNMPVTEEDLDAPIRAITVGIDGLNSYHFQVTEARKVAHADEVEDHVAATLDGYAVGEEWDRLGPGESSDRFYDLVRPDVDAPLPTVTASGGSGPGGAPGGVASVTHPTERRKFSIAELKRLCAFPDDYILTGTYAERWARLGNAVPPMMAYYIAKALADEVLL